MTRNRDQIEMARNALVVPCAPCWNWNRHDDLAAAFHLADVFPSDEPAMEMLEEDVTWFLSTTIVWG